jgi:predicted nucleic acid-binding protein
LSRLYLDTSVVVAVLVHEPGTAVAQAWLRSMASRPWQVSTWVQTELASALGMQCRRGVLSSPERDAVWSRFQAFLQGRLQLLDPVADDFALAARFCLGDGSRLRAGDALHLALCQRQNSVLVSFDKVLCEAARHHRIAVEQLIVTG